jgi:hypothetical protein
MAQPSDDIKAKLAQLREEFAAKAADDQRLKQAAWNAEQIATKKAKGGKITASRRADGIAIKGKTKGKIL